MIQYTYMNDPIVTNADTMQHLYLNSTYAILSESLRANINEQ